MDFSRDYLVHYYEADPDQRLTLPSLVRYFEDIAILHSEARGLGLGFYEQNHCGWMLIKWDIAVHALPSFTESVRVSTKVHAMKKFLADRVFALHAADGTLLAEARSNWLFVDTVRRRPQRIEENQYSLFGVTPESEAQFVTIDDVGEIGAGPDGSNDARNTLYTATIRASASDIDTNRHVNNVSYLEWALDSLPSDIVGSYSPTNLRAQYRKEIALGMEARVHSSFDSVGAVSRHSVRSDTEDFCALEITWKRRQGIGDVQ